LTPTNEQAQAQAAFATGETLSINAFAGAGKTSTLELLAQSTRRRGLYLAFNKFTATEAAAKLPKQVAAKTSHALAYRFVASQGYSTEKLTGALNAHRIAELMSLNPLAVGSIRLSARSHARLVQDTIARFCQSADHDVNLTHVPVTGKLGDLQDSHVDAVAKQIVGEAATLFASMRQKNNQQVPLGHDGYFKLWSLAQPDIDANYVMLDEAQDSNPALLSVLDAQRIQRVYVGDRYQQIYEWRGAVNAMERLSGVNALYLTQSFRFGSEIASVANPILATLGCQKTLVGASAHRGVLTCDAPNAVLCRTNAGLIYELMRADSAQRRVHILGGTVDLRWMLNDVTLLRQGTPATHPEFLGFAHWDDVVKAAMAEDDSLKTFVDVVESYGELHILDALDRTLPAESPSALTLSTGHKAKGREWDGVRISSDFKPPSFIAPDRLPEIDAKNIIIDVQGAKRFSTREERRLLYVAVTRAKKAIDLPAWFYDVYQV
jgi:UvrD-like helicase C-terminal domain/AAA domain